MADDKFTVKDSGKREVFSTGMQRDTAEGKTDYLLVFDGPMLDRWARHLTLGAKKYDKRNWMKASTQEELERFRESLGHHFIQYLRGEMDEDHAAAIFFNINGAEYVKDQLAKPRLVSKVDGTSLPCGKHEWTALYESPFNLFCGHCGEKRS